MSVVVVRYQAQLRQAAGRARQEVALAEPCSVLRLLEALAAKEPGLRRWLLDGQGRKQATLLVFVGDRQALAEDVVIPGDEVMLLTPIAGGE